MIHLQSSVIPSHLQTSMIHILGSMIQHLKTRGGLLVRSGCANCALNAAISYIIGSQQGSPQACSKHRWVPIQNSLCHLEGKLPMRQKHRCCGIGNLPSNWPPSFWDGSQRCFEYAYAEPVGLAIMHGFAAARATRGYRRLPAGSPGAPREPSGIQITNLTFLWKIMKSWSWPLEVILHTPDLNV